MIEGIKIEKTTADLFDSWELEYHKDCKAYLITGFPKSELADFVVAKDFKFTSKWLMYEKTTGLRICSSSSKTRTEAIKNGVDAVSKLADGELVRLVKSKLAHYSRYRSK